MKNTILKSVVIAAFAVMMSACTQKPAQTQEVTPILPEDVEVGPYHITALAENIYHIQDFNAANPAGESFDENGEKTHFNNCSDLYLLKGDDAALLIDLSNYVRWDSTCVESLRQFVSERIEDKPLTITFTHNHGDHTGMLPAYVGDTTVNFMLPRADFEDRLQMFEGCKYEMYDEGQTFDLGGLVINTVMVPGHTHGSTVFFLKDRDMVFTGDAIGSGHGVWIFNAEGFAEYTKAVPHLIEYIENPANNINKENLQIYGGHYWQKDWLSLPEGRELGWEYIQDMQTLINQIYEGKAANEPSNLGHPVLDTYFRLNNSIIVWNKEQAEAVAKK